MSLAIAIFNQQHTANAKPPRLSITRRNLPFTRYHKEQIAGRRGMPIARPARGRVHETNLRRRQKSGETQRRSRRRVISQRQIHFDILEMRFAGIVGIEVCVSDHLDGLPRCRLRTRSNLAVLTSLQIPEELSSLDARCCAEYLRQLLGAEAQPL